MKKNWFTALMSAVLVAMFVGVFAFAADVYDREKQDLAAGVGVWTNTVTYNPILLRHIWIQDSQNGGNTVTVSRIISSPIGNTQAIGIATYTAATSNGWFTLSATNFYMKNGDKLSFSASGTHATTAVAMIEYTICK